METNGESRNRIKIDEHFTYEDAISILNSLQSNTATIAESIKNRDSLQEIKRDSILRYLSYTGITPDMMHGLSVIHVAGTKGKGTTSSLCESILRKHGYRTGFYSSPHLITVTERIRLNGKPIHKDHFTAVFSDIYQQILEKKEHENDLPAYFGFLTVMALNIFIREKVDVAVIEVGIGGEYDQTNVVSNVPVVGITSLGLDHTNILGNTIEKIARQKAGIMKKGCQAYTVQQVPSAMEVLYEVSKQRKCTLSIVPDFEFYNWKNTSPEEANLENPTKLLNASLAIQLAHSWMTNNRNNLPREYVDTMETRSKKLVKDLPKETLMGLKSSVWPGRCQMINHTDKDVYLDGAHTVESIEICCDWFQSQCRKSSKKALIFYCTKDRNPEPMMKILMSLNFDLVFFVPDIPFTDEDTKKNLVDRVSLVIMDAEKIEKCKEFLKLWESLFSKYNSHTQIKEKRVIKVFSDVHSCMNFISTHYACKNIDKPQVLVTGSLLLVGAALAVLNPVLANEI